MEKHFLAQFCEGEQKFQPEPYYNAEGDCIVFQLADEAIVADRVDEVLTVYHSGIDDRPIGFQIKGVLALIQKFGFDNLSFDCKVEGDRVDSISIYALLFAAYEDGPRSIGRRKAYSSVFPTVGKNERIPRSELQPA